MNLSSFLIVFISMLVISSPVCSEPVPDRIIGRINILNPARLDAKNRKDLTAIAVKIKTSLEKGIVKLKGDVPAADSENEYILKSTFMARNVEVYLKPLLAGKYQIFITVPKYGGEKRSGHNSVEINLYPHELMVEADGFTATQMTAQELPPESEPVHDKPTQPVYQQPEQSGLLTPPPDDDEPVAVTSRKERVKQEVENATLANELVIRAKARAAEKMRRLQQAE